MNVAAGPELAAAVSNAGGLGVIGGLGYTPNHLRGQIKEIKANLKSPDLREYRMSAFNLYLGHITNR